jgi:hypothetical protein
MVSNRMIYNMPVPHIHPPGTPGFLRFVLGTLQGPVPSSVARRFRASCGMLYKLGIVFALVFGVAISLSAKIIYVDQTLDAKCHTYNATARNCSGSDWAFKTVQMALDSMSVGDSILLRGGTYQQGQINIPKTKTGTSWVAGNFNSIRSYPGEWAVIDGQRSLPNATEGILINGDSLVYWKFEYLEIKNGVRENDSASYGIHFHYGPVIIRYCNIHDNDCSWGGNNPAGISAIVPTKCTIEYCYFKNNAGTSNWNQSQLELMTDYAWAAIASGGYFDTLTTPRGKGVHDRQNIVRYNLFDSGAFVGIKYKDAQMFSGRNPDPGKGYNNTFDTLGDNVHSNIFRNLSMGITAHQDFCQIHNNIFDSCAQAIIIGDEASLYKNVVYNNTLNNCYGLGIFFRHDIRSLGPYTPEDDYYGYCYNNILDGCTYNSADANYSEEVTGFSYGSATLLNLKVNRNWTYRPRTHSYDPSGTNVLYFGDNATPRYTISRFLSERDASFIHYFSQYDSENLLYESTTGSGKYKTIGAHVINGDTIVSSAGIGGSHPYLDGVTIPSYVGATDPSDNDWVDSVLNLENLGGSYIPSGNGLLYSSGNFDILDTVSDSDTLKVITRNNRKMKLYLMSSIATSGETIVKSDSSIGKASGVLDTLSYSVDGPVYWYVKGVSTR